MSFTAAPASAAPGRTAILLSTYNGAAWLGEQLQSLRAQTDQDWQLVVRDDGSQDATLAVLGAFQPPADQTLILRDDHNRLGACQSFARLLQAAEADYYLFCDQDDRWQPDKVARLRSRLRALEAEAGPETPLLVHSDLRLVDQNLLPLRDSFWASQKLDVQLGAGLSRLLVQNVVTGCALMCNRALRDLALPLPAQALMHDWWLALVAAAFGRIALCPEKLVDYRQHAANAVGAKGAGLRYFAQRLRQRQEVQQGLQATQQQAAALAARFSSGSRRLSAQQLHLVQGYAEISQQGFWARRRFLLQNQILKMGWIRNAGLLLWV